MKVLNTEKINVDKSFEELLPEEDLGSLTASVSEQGILVPLMVDKNNLLIDGHRRLSVAKKLKITQVPVEVLRVGEGSWNKTVAIALNLYRRHLNEAQRAAIASSLLRLERQLAKKRKLAGQERGRESRKNPVVGTTSPVPPVRATEVAAKKVGIHRKTLERVERIKKESPKLARKMFSGKLSISAANKKLKIEKIKQKSNVSSQPGLVTDLKKVKGKYRTLYLDPPWQYQDNGGRGAAERHYPTMTLEEIEALPIPDLIHPEGAHVWIWTTWPMIRDGVPHQVIRAWNTRWKGEILWDKETVWDKKRLGVGSWVRSRTEVLILAVTKGLPLLSECVDPLVSEKRPNAHSEKPSLFRDLIKEIGPGPRLELFARSAHRGWDRWGLES